MKLGDLARRIGCILEGDAAIEISGPAPIDEAGPGQVTFVANPRYQSRLKSLRASAVILAPAMDAPGVAILRTEQPYAAFVRLLELFHEPLRPAAGTHATAQVSRSARIRRGAKIDNLVQIGHGCEVGESALLAAQVGLAGSTKIGPGAQLGGQVGAAGHLTIGAGARVAAQSGIPNDVAAGAVVSGYPAVDIRTWRRAVAIWARL